MKLVQSPIRLLVVDLEPAPYKVDLWNAFAGSKDWQIEVLYTNAKDVSKDAGHNYQNFPESQFHHQILSGNSIVAGLKKIFAVIRAIASTNVDTVFISGYVNVGPLTAIFTSIFLQKPFFIHSDIFNNKAPNAPGASIKRWIRDGIRVLVFRYANAVLVCGKLGYESAIAAGCSKDKVVDFPYVIDRKRLLADKSVETPRKVLRDVQSRRSVLYFSGRMIERKGLKNLLDVLSQIERDSEIISTDWVLWVAGDGPLFNQYCAQAKSLGIGQRVRFLGFVQMDLHSWLLRNASIIIVPSLSDSWGIVVDEGMQAGKAVIASTGVGSAVDRIESGINGLLFAPGNTAQLKEYLIQLMTSSGFQISLGQNAMNSTNKFSPERNVVNLTNALAQNLVLSK
jgi:glycosyltransferase involved in cell wall biosynthesis